jgi:hypothetical protein
MQLQWPAANGDEGGVRMSQVTGRASQMGFIEDSQHG